MQQFYGAQLAPDVWTLVGGVVGGPPLVELGDTLSGVKTISLTDDSYPVFAPHGRTLVTIGTDRIRTWRMDAGKAPMRLDDRGSSVPRVPVEDLNARVLCLAYSPNGSRLALSGLNCILQLWTPDNHQMISLRGHTKMVWRVAFSPDSKVLAPAGGDKTVRPWQGEDRPRRRLASSWIGTTCGPRDCHCLKHEAEG